MGVVEPRRAQDARIICGSDELLIEQRLRKSIKEGWDLESMVSSTQGVCILMVDRRLPRGEEII